MSPHRTPGKIVEDAPVLTAEELVQRQQAELQSRKEKDKAEIFKEVEDFDEKEFWLTTVQPKLEERARMGEELKCSFTLEGYERYNKPSSKALQSIARKIIKYGSELGFDVETKKQHRINIHSKGIGFYVTAKSSSNKIIKYSPSKLSKALRRIPAVIWLILGYTTGTVIGIVFF